MIPEYMRLWAARFCAVLFIILRACAAVQTGFLTYSPGSPAYSEFCPDVKEYQGRQPISINSVQFENGEACGRCLNILKTRPPRSLQKDCVVTNVLPQGESGDLDMPVRQTGRSRVSWTWTDCETVDEADP